MRKGIVYLTLFLSLLATTVLADGNMMDFGNNNMMGGYGVGGFLGMGVIGLIYFAIAAFIFSVIFWLTYKWLIKKD
jgi:hypothetical protein